MARNRKKERMRERNVFLDEKQLITEINRVSLENLIIVADRLIPRGINLFRLQSNRSKEKRLDTVNSMQTSFAFTSVFAI